MEFEKIIKSLSAKCAPSEQLIASLRECFAKLSEKAEAGEEYRTHLRQKALKMCLIAQPEMRADTIEMLTGRMSIDELKSFTEVYEKAAAKVMPLTPQLAKKPKSEDRTKDDNYII